MPPRSRPDDAPRAGEGRRAARLVGRGGREAPGGAAALDTLSRS
ncbi:hypothetical protein [Sorangium sp. So ce1153]